MISFDKWLYKSISYDNNYHIKDVLNLMIEDIFFWIKTTPEIECEYSNNTFKDNFYQMIYNNYLYPDKDNFTPYDEEMYEYFTLKFSNDINDLFMKFRNICNLYNLDLFHQKNDNSLNLQDFLFDYLLIEDPYYDSDNDENNIENNIDYNIDEF